MFFEIAYVSNSSPAVLGRRCLAYLYTPLTTLMMMLVPVQPRSVLGNASFIVFSHTVQSPEGRGLSTRAVDQGLIFLFKVTVSCC